MARNHKNWLTAYYHYTRHSESPDLFHFWTGVSTIAGALRRQVWIEEFYYQWTPNFYIIMVAPAGIVSKSTSARIGMKLLERVPGVTFGPKSMTWQGLTIALQDAQKMIPIGLEGDFLNMSAITCVVSELGTFLRPQDKEMIDVLTDLWDGQLENWTRKLKSSDTNIENPWINVIACTTPSWMEDNYTEAMVGGGLTSRIVFVYGEEKRHLMAHPSDVIDPVEFAEAGDKLVEDLIEISQIQGQYEYQPDAKAWSKNWYDTHWTTRPEHMASKRYDGYRARKQSHIHKLAMVVAAAQRNELYLTKDDLIIADNMTSGLENSMTKVFQSIGSSESARHVSEILSYIKGYNGMTSLNLWRHMMPLMTRREFEEATDGAIKAGYIELGGSPPMYTMIKQKKEKESDM